MSDEQRKQPGTGLLQEWWSHPWGRTLIIAVTVATVSWAVRETAVITRPLGAALQTVLVPLGIGFVIAYVLTPLVDAMERWGMKRTFATPVLFLLLSILAILVTSLGMPSMVRQGSELLTRFFSDVHYYDENGNERFDKGEIVLIRGEDDQGLFFFEDRNGDGLVSPSERRFVASASSVVRFEPSLVRQGMEWLEATQHRVEIMLDAPPKRRALLFLAHYLEQTTGERQALQEAISRLKAGLPPPALTEGTEARGWNPDWPWALTQTPEELLAEIGEAQRINWLHALAERGQAWADRHELLLQAWRRVRGGQAAVGPVGEGLRQVLAAGLPQDRLDEALIYLQELRDASGTAERTLLYALYDEGRNSPIWQDALDQVRGVVAGKATAIGNLAGQGAEAALSNVGGIMQFGLDIILVPIYAFFLTLVMPTMRGAIARYLPGGNRDRLLRIGGDIERVVAAFFRGRLIVCLICAILCTIGFLLLDVPYALLFGLLIGLATAVPLSGLLFLVPAVLLVLSDGGESVLLRSGLVVMVYTVIQTLEATVFTPTIMGREVELHPVVLIAALVFLGNLLGVLGLLLAVPIAATIRILLREFVWHRLRDWAGVPETRRLVDQGDAPAVEPAKDD